MATAAVFGFLSFAGFEGAAALGEETDEPARNIPRAILLAPLTVGIFFVIVILTQTVGFGTATAASRILFALSRDGLPGSPLGRAANAFLYPGTIGVLSLLVAYIATNLGAIRHLFLRARQRPWWELIFPLVGIAFLVFTIYKNVAGTTFPYDRFPWVVLAWLVLGALIVALAPRVARRIGIALTREVTDESA